MTARSTRTIASGSVCLRMLMVVAAATLGACETDSWDAVHVRPEPRVSVASFLHDAYFAPRASTLGADERSRLRAFFDANRPSRGDTVIVTVPPPSAGGTGTSLAERRARSIAAVLGKTEAQVRLVVVDRLDPSIGDRAEIAIQKYVVTLPRCPDWSDRPGLIFENQPLSNFGCATAVNFGLMVANPADLIGADRSEPADGERQAKAFERYRTDAVKPFIESGGDQKGEDPQIKITTQ